MPREWLRNTVLPLQPLEPESEICGFGGRIYRDPLWSLLSCFQASGCRWVPETKQVLQAGFCRRDLGDPQPWL